MRLSMLAVGGLMAVMLIGVGSHNARRESSVCSARLATGAGTFIVNGQAVSSDGTSIKIIKDGCEIEASGTIGDDKSGLNGRAEVYKSPNGTFSLLNFRPIDEQKWIQIKAERHIVNSNGEGVTYGQTESGRWIQVPATELH